jgi:hypothetical protein
VRHNSNHGEVAQKHVAVGVGVALIFALAMIIGNFFGGLLGMFACALLAGVACGALVANDERKT